MLDSALCLLFIPDVTKHYSGWKEVCLSSLIWKGKNSKARMSTISLEENYSGKHPFLIWPCPPSLALSTPWNWGITVYHQSSTNKDPVVIGERKLTVKEVLNLAKHERDAVARMQTFRWKEGGTEWNQSWVGAVRYSNGLSNFISQKSSAWVWWLVRQSQTTETCNFLPDSKRLPIFIDF